MNIKKLLDNIRIELEVVLDISKKDTKKDD